MNDLDDVAFAGAAELARMLPRTRNAGLSRCSRRSRVETGWRLRGSMRSHKLPFCDVAIRSGRYLSAGGDHPGIMFLGVRMRLSRGGGAGRPGSEAHSSSWRHSLGMVNPVPRGELAPMSTMPAMRASTIACRRDQPQRGRARHRTAHGVRRSASCARTRGTTKECGRGGLDRSAQAAISLWCRHGPPRQTSLPPPRS